MSRISSILTHVLATSLLSACGGAVTDSSGKSTSSSGDPPSGTATAEKDASPPPPPKLDSGTTEDAGCTAGPVLVSAAACSDVWQWACGLPAGVVPDDGLSSEECAKVCGGKTTYAYAGCGLLSPSTTPIPSFDCYTCVEGRRPAGYVAAPLVPSIAGWLAHAADLERVSIDAFQVLHRELSHHDAPAALLERAQRAEADEVRHARALSALARREGATLSSATVGRLEARPLVDIAIENAVEGCIRETYGALVAGWQARHAQRIDIRRVMATTYEDETAHAALAWDVHAWLGERLSDAERARVADAMTAACAELVRAAGTPLPDDVVAALGLPSVDAARSLLAGLDLQLFAPALAA